MKMVASLLMAGLESCEYSAPRPREFIGWSSLRERVVEWSYVVRGYDSIRPVQRTKRFRSTKVLEGSSILPFLISKTRVRGS
jgi:hypothetical protein